MPPTGSPAQSGSSGTEAHRGLERRSGLPRIGGRRDIGALDGLVGKVIPHERCHVCCPQGVVQVGIAQ